MVTDPQTQTGIITMHCAAALPVHSVTILSATKALIRVHTSAMVADPKNFLQTATKKTAYPRNFLQLPISHSGKDSVLKFPGYLTPQIITKICQQLL